MKRFNNQNSDSFSRQSPHGKGEDESREDGGGRNSSMSQRSGGGYRSSRGGGFNDGNKSFGDNFQGGSQRREGSDFDRAQGQRDHDSRGRREAGESNVWSPENNDGGGYKARQSNSDNFSHRSNNFDGQQQRGGGGNNTWNNGGNQRRSNFSSDVPPRFQNKDRDENRQNSREEGSENGRPFYQSANKWGSDSNKTNTWNADDSKTRSYSNTGRDERSGGERNDAQRGTNNSEENRNDRGGENRSRNFSNYGGNRDSRNEPYKPPNTWNNDENKSKGFSSNNISERGGRNENSRPPWNRDENSKSSWNKDENAKPSWNKDENSKPSWNKDENSKPSWNKDENSKPSWNKDENSKSSWNKDDNSKPSWNKDDNSKPSWKKDENSKPSWNKDENSKPSWNKDENSKPSWNKDDNARSSWNKDESSRPSWKKDDNARSSWNKDESGGGGNYNSNRNDNQRSSWNRDSSNRSSRPANSNWTSPKTNGEVSWEDTSAAQASPGTNVSEVKIEVGEYKEISVVHVITPDEFYCNLVDFKTQSLYQAMSEKMSLKYGETGDGKKLDKCEVGGFCAACFSEDQVWYRAKILSIDGAQAEVAFVDYGNTDSCALDSLKALDADVAELPARAIKCALFGVKSEEEEWSEEEAVHFEGVVTKAHYLARFLERNEAKDGFVVDLVDSFLLGDLSLRFQLMRERAVVPRSTSDSVYSLLASSALGTQEAFAHLSLEVGAKMKMYVSWVNFPGEFYARDVSAEAEWSAFDARLNADYAALAPHEMALTELEKGLPCVTPFVYHGTKGWYRSLILAVEKEHVVVSYVDYGNVERVKFQDVKSIKIEFMELPAQAVLLNVANLKPLGTHWKSVSQSELGKYLAGDLDCEVKEVVGRKYVVEASVGEQDVATRMIQDGLAYLEEGHSISVSHTLQAVVDRIVDSSQVKIVEPPVPVPAAAAASTVVTCSELTSAVEPSVESSPKTQAADATITSAENSSAELTNETEAQPNLDDSPVGSSGIVVGSRFSAGVSFVTGVDSFYVQRSSDFERIDNLLALLNEAFSGSDPEENLKSKVGEMCVARYDFDQGWYRALIREQRDFGFEVLFVDYGNAEFVTFDQIRSVPASWADKPSLALRCRLDKLDPNCEQLKDALNEILEAVQMAAEVEVKGIEAGEGCETVFLVDLTCAGEDVAKTLKEKCGIAAADVEQQVEVEETGCKVEEVSASVPAPELVVETTGSGKLVNVKAEEFVLGEKVEVFVSYIDSPDRFWVQKTSNSTRLETLLEGLAESCSKLEEYGEKLEGKLGLRDLCAVKFSADDFWYRGEVESLSEEGSNVFFVDFGNCELFENGSARVQKLEKEEWRSDAFFATQCQLRAPEGGVWSAQAKELFKSNYDSKVCLAEVLERKGDGAYEVRLLDMGLDVAKVISGSEKEGDSSSLQENESSATENETTSFTGDSSSAVESSVNESSSSVIESSSSVIESSNSVIESSSCTNESSGVLNESSVQAGKMNPLSSDSSSSEVTEGFDKGLVVPTYGEFAESASVHPRSESPSLPSSTSETQVNSSDVAEERIELGSNEERNVVESFISKRLDELRANAEGRKKSQESQAELSTDFDKESSEAVAERNRETENSSDDVGEGFLESKAQVLGEMNGTSQSRQDLNESDDSSTLENTSGDVIEVDSDLLKEEEVVVVND